MPNITLDGNSTVCSNQLSCQLKMTVNKKAAISPVLAVAFEKFFHGQMKNYQDKPEMSELFSPTGLASQVLFRKSVPSTLKTC